jgi:hypothetical protein
VRALTGATHAAEVHTPPVTGSEKKVDSGEFGAVSLYLMLASRDSQQQSLTAADGWGGDSYVAYQQGGTTCMRLRFAGRTTTDTARIHSALQEWAAAGPTGASVTLTQGQVQVQSCDPGDGVHAGTENSSHAVSFAAVRNQYVVTLTRAHVPPVASHCIADGLFASYPFSELVKPTFGANDPTVQAHIRDLAIGCR